MEENTIIDDFPVYEELPSETSEPETMYQDPEEQLPVPDTETNEIDSAKVEETLKKFIQDALKENEEKEENQEEENQVEENQEEENQEEETKEPETNITTEPVKDYEPLLNQIVQDIKNSDTSKEVKEIYSTMTTTADYNNINAPLNSQSATNVIMLAILTVLLFDTVVHFIRGFL